MHEVNFDGIVGPTHNYAGLSLGNIASVNNYGERSNPRKAALQGLEKMYKLAQHGFYQAVLLPHERPHMPTLRKLGFTGDDSQILAKAFKEAPELLIACSSAASMWAANAATTAPSIDTIDRKVHFTPANLTHKFHRSIEPPTTERMLRKIFSSPSHFMHHSPLPSGGQILCDEGAANHTRLCHNYDQPGVHLFVYGRTAWNKSKNLPKKFPARQTYEASQSIARLLQLNPEDVLFAQQNPKAIDSGVFHNDVICLGNQNILFYHEYTFLNTKSIIKSLRKKMSQKSSELICIEVKEKELPLEDAVASYLFNSQLLTLNNGQMIIAAPIECREIHSATSVLNNIVQSPNNPVSNVMYFNLRESMRNGGGPACLRLRVILNEQEMQAIHQDVILTPKLYKQLAIWINKHYRTELWPKDLADSTLLYESRKALDELTKILHLENFYEFQG